MSIKLLIAIIVTGTLGSCTLTSTSPSDQGPKQAVGTITGMVLGGKIANDLTEDSSKNNLWTLAGVTLGAMETAMPNGVRVVRVMPNLNALVRELAAGFCCGKHATKQDAALVKQLLSTVGKAEEVPEKLMDAVTGLSGSGPAFGFLMVEALADGGVRAGLPRPTA